MLLNLSGMPAPCTAVMLLSCDDGWPTKPAPPWSPPCCEALPGGSGLFRMSFRLGLEEEGVRTGDWLDSLDEPIDDGEVAPSLASLFFLDDLFGSLPRESCQAEQTGLALVSRGDERELPVSPSGGE